MTRLTDAELEALLDEVASDRAERKEAWAGDVPEKACQAICAFANDLTNHQQPGVLFVGVDDKGVPKNMADLRELWRRMVFSLLASNYDDHLRNHGFLMHRSGRWSLSPAYDINPVPEVDRIRMSKTPISEEQAEPTLAGALAVAGRFGLKVGEAKNVLGEVHDAVSGWRTTGRKLRIKAATLEAYASAFEHPLMKEAGNLIGK